MSVAQIRLLARLARWLPGGLLQVRRRHLKDLEQTIGTVEGRPIVAFLRIAYALDRSTPAMDDSRHPARDGRGILRYAPLVPLTGPGLDGLCIRFPVEVAIKLSSPLFCRKAPT